jgi:hypothetical protein
MTSQSVSFDFLSRGASQLSSDFRRTGDSATLAAKGARLLADSLDKQRRATDASARATLSLVKADAILEEAEKVLSDEALRAEFALKQQADAARKAGRANEEAAASAAAAGEGFGGLGGGMGVAVAAGVALAPVLVTLGVGFAGLGAAAAGVAGPIEKAAHKAGGLKANLGSLDAEQRLVAVGVLGLGKQFAVFQKELEPEVVGAFSEGLKIAGRLMADVRPVAQATGKAFDQFLGQFGATLQDPQWQRFWAFMAATAPQDMRLLGNTVIGLTNDLPGLLRALQPAAEGVLTLGGDATKALGPLTRLIGVAEGIDKAEFSQARSTDKAAESWTNKYIPGAKAVNDWLTRVQHTLSGTSGATDTYSAAAQAAADKTRAMRLQAAAAAASVAGLMKAEQASLTTLTTYAGDLVTTAGDAASLRTALKASHDQIGLHTAAQRASFASANTYISQLAKTASEAYTSGHGVDASIKAIKGGLPVLDQAKTRNRAYWQEVAALVGWLRRLQAIHRITEQIRVTGTGHWAATSGELPGQPGMHFVGRYAAGSEGAAPGWAWVGEKGAELVRFHGGEHVLSHEQSRRVAGYASGTYAGGLAGLRPWASHANTVSERATAAWVAMAETAQMIARFARAFSAIGGAVGGDAAANIALGRRMFPWPAYMWPAQLALWTRESSWNRFARNPSSGAYGIPQALPATKMPFAAQAAGGSHAGAQIGWGYGYERGRYGNPLAAWAHELRFGWYGNGLDTVFKVPTVIGVGDRGPEHVRVTPLRGGGEHRVVVELRLDALGLDEFQLHSLRRAIRTRGGNAQLVLGRN